MARFTAFLGATMQINWLLGLFQAFLASRYLLVANVLEDIGTLHLMMTFSARSSGEATVALYEASRVDSSGGFDVIDVL